jgi:UDP-N-acetylmuramate-alanine ligase
LPEFPAIVKYLRAEARPGDLILTMGAGNVWEIARDLVEENQPQMNTVRLSSPKSDERGSE